MKFLATSEPRVTAFAYPAGPQTNQGFRRYDNVAQYGNNSSVVTGAIIFEIPLGFANHMQVHNFTGYEYASQGGGWQARVSFYSRNTNVVTYPTVTYDTSPTASPVTRPLVRVGRRISSGHPVIIFGDLTTVWTYPKLMMTSSFVAYQTPTATTFDNIPDPILEATSFAAYDLITTCFDNTAAGPNDSSVLRASGSPTSGAVGYGTGTGLGYTAAGTARQVLQSNGSGVPTWTTLDLTYLPDAWVKKAVRVATTANITLSAPQTIDGVAVVAGDRVLVKNQTTTSQNGIYDVAAGAWTRAAGADSASEVAGATTSVDQGTANGGQVWSTTFKATDTLGTTAMLWYLNLDTNATDVLAAGRSLPRGVFSGGYAQIVANSANTAAVTTPVDITGLAVTVTPVASRRVRLSITMNVQSTIANDRAALFIREGAVTLASFNTPQLVTAAASYSFHFSTILTAPTAAAHTYKVSIARLTGTGTITATAAATLPAWILAEDIGPST